MSSRRCWSRRARPMDVLVHSKRGQRPHSASRPSVLGNGLLERARSTSLALLGLTAAVGLTMVALALNQGWPLIAGGPIPHVPPLEQGVGEASIAAGVGGSAGRSEPVAAGPRSGGAVARDEKRRRGQGGIPAADSEPTASDQFVVAPSVPAKSQGDRPDGAPDRSQPPPDDAQPPKQAAPKSPTTSPVASPELVAAPPSPEPSSPVATASDVPAEESDGPPWSKGGGHAYGYDDDDDDDWDKDDDWDHGHGHDHDWDHDHGHDWDD
jgi:hypothetical protein